jgi:hypothetical protein
MNVTRAHIMGWAALAVAAAALIIDVAGDEPAQATPAPAVSAPVNDGWQPAAGNLWPGTDLYFGRHEKMYRGQIAQFVKTDQGEAAVLVKDGQVVQVILRKDIATRDFWVRAE